MISREIMHCIETCCRYLDPQNRFFGGKVRDQSYSALFQTVLLGGDWKQLLPVVILNRNESHQQVVTHTLLSWDGFNRLFKTEKLLQNQRTGPGEKDFAKYVGPHPKPFRFLDEVGLGLRPRTERGVTTLPDEIIAGSEDEVIKWAFCNEDGTLKDLKSIENTVILTPHNDASMEINEKVEEEKGPMSC